LIMYQRLYRSVRFLSGLAVQRQQQLSAISNLSGISRSSQLCSHRLMSSTSSEADAGAPGVGGEADDAQKLEQQQQEVAALAKRCSELQTAMDQLQDKYVRALAESENTRRRLTRQAEEARIFGISAFCKDLLDVADVLAKANETAPPEADPTLVEGLRMTEAQLKQVFRRHKLEPIKPDVGEKFDPNQHEALFEVPVAENCQPGTVAVVTKVGYRLHERTLRPALVGVVKYT
ncbi:hypothetical protein BOX15_Mlig023729g4, partial [Macrostomum lignano]